MMNCHRRLKSCFSEFLIISAWLLAPNVPAQSRLAPTSHPVPPSLEEPKDHPFNGEVRLNVDAIDINHSIFRVSETIPTQKAGDEVLLYPEWDASSHAPNLSVVDLAGLKMKVDGQPVEWRRDAYNPHAFHVEIPPNTRELSLSFDYLSPARDAVLRSQMVM